jgi:hypothetical protein
VDELFEMTHAPETPRVGGGRLAAPLFPLRDWTARVRTYFFTPGVDTPAFRLYESQVTLQRDLTFEGGRYPNVRLLDWDHGAPMAKGDFLYATVTMEDGRTLVEQTPEANDWPRVAYQGTLPLGGYAGAFPNYTGAGAVFALEPGLAFSVEGNAKSRRIGVGRQIPPGTVLKAGTVLTARMLTMEGAWRKLGRNTEIENTRQFLGLTGKPAYTITPTVGKVADTFYICTLQPENGAFRAKFSQAPLPVDLPVMVKGLNERWESGVWIVGHPRGVRFFGKWEGNGYTTLRLDKGPVDAFIGHPIVCDAEAVWLTLVEADEKHLLVSAHNPTDREIKTRVRKSQGFDLGPGLDKTVTIPAGTSVTVSTP